MMEAQLEDSVQNHERAREIKEFDESKAGVKGLVDAGILKIPHFFVTQSNDDEMSASSNIHIPIVDLIDIKDKTTRKNIVEQIGQACEIWGFFQVVNHGIPQEIMDEMIQGVDSFHNLPNKEKMEVYSRDVSKKVRFYSNIDLYQAKSANWRDSLACQMAPHPPNLDELPKTCKEIIVEYSDHIKKLGEMLFELLAEALGLKSNHLIDMDCAKGHVLVCHYYPTCPEPDRTIGITKHTDPDFFTILLQDHIGGLQIYHQNAWVDINPLRGALVLISNDKFKSAEHRVLVNRAQARLSVACFFTTHYQSFNKLYGPIKELTSEDSPPLYIETTIEDYISYYNFRGLDAGPALSYLRL
ncbi:hypothetical protein Leryth_002614 [Lithospermum erythrorhizon]|nr:hypothetical protein Leryth_002614 [Lithospermum erythrorhizon]